MQKICHTTKAAALIIICLSLLAGFFLLPSRAEAAEAWMQESLDKLTGWGVMKGYPDGQLHEYDPMTRAQFVAMVNRALGYTETGTTPFTDVPATAWYADDIAIAYNAGYFNGTSANTASPDTALTREQAVVILARNLRLEETVGEVMEFTDGDKFNNWGKGYIRSAVKSGMISGYSDGSFQPQRLITRGEMAKVLTNALGTLVRNPEAQTLTGVYGNVTVNTPNVTLRDTTIAGNLYLSGGVGLGGVTLENLKVLGKIVIVGGGESESGDISIVLRNVEANELVVDSLSGQYTSLSAEGTTKIDSATIRTNAFIRDNTAAGYGLLNINLAGGEGATYNLAGKLKTVKNLAPGSALTISRGTVDKLTVDEKALGSSLILANNAKLSELNLDSATGVSGNGDIAKLNVAVDGCVVDMLPDKITVRPGTTANINKETMDTVAAEESSADPRILAGYPQAKSVASSSLNAVFQTNKPGKLYWVVCYDTEGAPGAADIIAPPEGSGTILKSGSIAVTSSNTDYSAKVTGLQVGGHYLLCAVLTDAHGWQSPVKSVSFTTPDDSVPAFASGYPYMSQITKNSAQVTAMTTKSCLMYYAVLPKGSVTPTSAEFVSGSMSGSLGYGVVEMTKNMSESIGVNSQELAELGSYELFLWLTDVDGAKSSAVKKISFTTIDGTPPVFQTKLTVNAVKATSIGFTGNLNEAGTVFWVVVPEGSEYPKPDPDGNKELTSSYSKLQVYSGMNALKSGKTAAKANTDFSFTVSGLTAETAYDVYYLATDTAGNYCASIEKLTANTLDSVPPSAKQQFTSYSGSESTVPYATTDVILTFSENIQRASTNKVLLDLYRAVQNSTGDGHTQAVSELAEALSATIQLYNNTGSGQPKQVKQRTSNADTDWVIDYRNAKLELAEGKLIITLATTADTSYDSALNLSSGGTYFFRLKDIADTSSSKNLMGQTDLPSFTTISAQVALAKLNITKIKDIRDNDVRIDVAFSMTPLSTSKADADVDWDMLLWTDSSVSFELYRRERTVSGPGSWEKVGEENSVTTANSAFVGRSLGAHFEHVTKYPNLRESLDEATVYEYGVHFTQVSGSSEVATWSQKVTMRISVVAGSSVDLNNLSANIIDEKYAAVLNGGLSAIGVPKTFEPYVQFADTETPKFVGSYPEFKPTDCLCDINLLLDRPGTVFYAIAPEGSITTKVGETVPDFLSVSTGGKNATIASAPGYLDIVNPRFTNTLIKTGSIALGTGASTITIGDLLPNQNYYAYFVIKSAGQYYPTVYLYGFKTATITRPVLSLDHASAVVNMQSNLDTNVSYIVIPYNTSSLYSLLKAPFTSAVDASTVLAEKYKASDYTVLDAMCESPSSGFSSGGSVFDEYSSAEYKASVAEYIRRSASTPGSSVVGSGSASLKAKVSSPVDCGKMSLSKNADYCFLVVGRSKAGSGDAFRGIFGVSLSDNEAPKVTQLLSDLRTNADGTISGNVTLVFNEDLYYLQRSGTKATLLAIDLGPLTTTPPRTDYISILSLISSPINSTKILIKPISDPQNSAVGQPTNSIVITFDNAPSGTNMVFKNNLSDKDTNVRTESLTVSASVTPITGGGYSAPVVTIPGVWDGR